MLLYTSNYIVLLLLKTLLTRPVNKEKIEVKAEPGDLLLFTRAKGLNRTITWLTRSSYYHVGIYRGDNQVIESRPRGVVCRDLNGPDGDKSFVVVPAPGGREAGLAALRWAETQIGNGYDAAGAFVIILDQLFSCSLPYTTHKHFSCGELVAKAYAEAGYELLPHRVPECVVPADFEQFLPENEKTPDVVK
jgi:uncharacterized protein YycO